MKTQFIIILFLLLSLSSSKQIKAQSNAEIKLLRSVVQPPQKRVYKEAKGNKNEVQYLFSGLFLFYKTFFSSQDLTVCTFTPSCSEFGILAVKKNGIVMGGIKTMDRLTRCNGLSPEKYEIDIKAKLLIDKP
ncbi:membrane protein insertion efficiency factor YidD [Emticicia aquatica]|jgi:putative component of membrane protein insertase Oxa1/YidC/SpoIIIJ protein YidD|uniref:membrane protein insertion efficiency factor YidD n=1 Tax=Emticicia aquatica TaxID=1681835 RepID=UPI001EEA0898|nr:membrane protein insertion efficiency factor YidD [Emticicia aquatica]